MDSGAWLRDYEADEAGLLPPGFRRGVLSEDGLYNLLADAASARPVIHIFGASGSGTTTLGRYIAERTGMRHMDTDDYYWLPTDPRFTVRRPVEERLTLMRADLDRAARGTVISGSLCGWGDSLISRFTLCIRVVTPARVRLERLHAREAARFGARIDAGGDMHQQHLDFLDWAARYDDGPADMRSRTMHDQWQSALPCPVITVDGTQSLADLWAQLQPHIP